MHLVTSSLLANAISILSASPVSSQTGLMRGIIKLQPDCRDSLKLQADMYIGDNVVLAVMMRVSCVLISKFW
jgi:hypothetical protein